MSNIDEIYSTSRMRKKVIDPVGRFFAFCTVVAPVVKNVKKDEELYKAFYLTKIELVQREKLSDLQKNLLLKNPQLKAGPLYLATFVGQHKGKYVDRAFFTNIESIKKLGVDVYANEKDVIGDGKDVLVEKAFDVYSIEQNFGTVKMQLKRTEETQSSFEKRTEELQKVRAVLKNPEQVSHRPFLWFVSGWRKNKSPKI